MAAKLTADMKRVVADQRLAYVATVCSDGTPNVSPKGTIAVWDDEHLVFADIRSPETIANLKKNPAVELGSDHWALSWLQAEDSVSGQRSHWHRADPLSSRKYRGRVADNPGIEQRLRLRRA